MEFDPRGPRVSALITTVVLAASRAHAPNPVPVSRALVTSG